MLGGLLEALPADRAEVVSALAKAGDGSQSTLDPAGLADRLLDLKQAADDQDLVSDVLPVTEIDTGAGTPSYGIDAAQAAAMMRTRFPGALQKDAAGEVLRVLVENGVGTPGLVEKARTKLVDDGFRFINGGKRGVLRQRGEVPIIPYGTDKSAGRGERVAKSLGLPTTSVRRPPTGARRSPT